MPNEVYRTQVDIRFKSRGQTTTFFWLVDNTSHIHPFRLASAINFSLMVETTWLFDLLAMVSEHAEFRRMETQQIRPNWGPTCYGADPLGPINGGWLNDLDDNFQSANLTWHFTNDLTGKHQVRIGPIGRTARSSGNYHFSFVAKALTFISQHVTPRLLDVGLTAIACINHQDSGGTPIEGGFLNPFFGRQENRRWRA